MRPHLRFIDPCAPRAYADPAQMRGLGGTETTLLHIATALAQDIAVTVEQAARDTPQVRRGVRFLPMNLAQAAGDTIVVVNSWKVALLCRKHNPLARICVWQHVFPGRHNRALAPDLARARIEVLCVSQTHAATVSNFLWGQVRVTAVPNPIADDLLPDVTPRDPDLLFFASSPHKGLDQVVAAFATLRRTIPTLRLELADPGYLAWDNGAMPDGVVALGTLSHAQVIARMRQALCLFCPQTRFAETFGLVLAEANAVGCPALVHEGLGANDEVTSTTEQCIDATDPGQIARRILAWRARPPVVRLLPQFRQSVIVQRWQRLLVRDSRAVVAKPEIEFAQVWAAHRGGVWSDVMSMGS